MSDFSELQRLSGMLDQMSGFSAVQEAVLDGLEVSGRKIQASAKDECPVDTGELKNSIICERREDHVLVEAEAPHGIFVEYGTGKRGDPSVPHREDWAGMKPQPYMRPAYERHRKSIHEDVIKALGKKIGRRG